MAAVDPNLKFRYIVVDGEMVEIPENEIHDETSVNSWLFHRFADSQVSSGWMAAAYRCMQNDVIVIPDPSPSTASLPSSQPPASENTLPSTSSSSRRRSRSRRRSSN